MLRTERLHAGLSAEVSGSGASKRLCQMGQSCQSCRLHGMATRCGSMSPTFAHLAPLTEHQEPAGALLEASLCSHIQSTRERASPSRFSLPEIIHCAEALLKFHFRLVSIACLCSSISKESAGIPLLALSRWQAAKHVCLLTAECSWRLVEVSRAAAGQISKNNNVRQLSCLSSKNVEWCRRSPVMDGNTALHLPSENGWHWHARPPVLDKGGCSNARQRR